MVEWVLCSSHFNHLVLLAPEGLNNTSIDASYQEIPSKQIKKVYFNHTHIIITGLVDINKKAVPYLHGA